MQTYIRAVFDRITNEHSIPCETQGELIVDEDDRARVTTLSFLWNRMRVRVRFEIHTEYLSITSMLDASISAPATEVETPLFLKTKSALEEFANHCQPGRALSETRLRELYHLFYHDVWENHFFPQILNAGRRIARGRVGKKFADFRGFITCETYPDEAGQARENSEGFTEPLEASPLQGPAYRAETDKRDVWQRTLAPKPQWARARLDAAWGFLTSSPMDLEPFLTGRTEFTVSRVVGGRMLYATALGPQPAVGGSGHEQPLYFYLHSATQCPRQIGRTVDRVCQMGTLRLAAIISLPALKLVSRHLLDVETTIVSARAATHALVKDSKSWDNERGDYPPYRKGQEYRIVELLDQVQNDMAELSGGKGRFGSEYLGDSTLEYRLVRSRYYRESFFALLDGFRIRRLEGYQPYDEFVRRRLGSIFGFIGGVERRIEQIKLDWRALDQLYLSTSVTLLTDEIDKEEGSITKLQTTGELLLVLVLVPYYLFSIFIMDIADCQQAGQQSGKCSSHSWFNSDPKVVGFAAIWLLCLVGYAVLRRRAVVRVWRQSVSMAGEQLSRLVRR
jgi:hypothetical protein